MLVSKPIHSKYALSSLEEDEYRKMVSRYSKAKRLGLRGIFSWASGAGFLGVAKDVAKGTVINYGKRKFAAVAINGALYICSLAVIVFTNATKVVKWAGRVHSASSFVFECVEDSGNLVFLPFDMAIFGQPIPVGSDGRFDLIGDTHDFLD